MAISKKVKVAELLILEDMTKPVAKVNVPINEVVRKIKGILPRIIMPVARRIASIAAVRMIVSTTVAAIFPV
jgi:hypothetical protein